MIVGALAMAGVIPTQATLTSSTPATLNSMSWNSGSNSYALSSGTSLSIPFSTGTFSASISFGSATSGTGTLTYGSTSVTLSRTVYGSTWIFTSGTISLTAGTATSFTFTFTDNIGDSISESFSLEYVPPSFTITSLYSVNGGGYTAFSSSSVINVHPTDTVAFEVEAATTFYALTASFACSTSTGTCPAMSFAQFTSGCPSTDTCWATAAASFPAGTYTISGTVTSSAGAGTWTAFSVFADLGPGGSTPNPDFVPGFVIFLIGLGILVSPAVIWRRP